MLLNMDVLKEFSSGYNGEITASSIAKKSKLNQKTVANYLNMLEKENIMKSRADGRNKLFSFRLKNELPVENFLCMIEHLKTIEFFKSNPVIKEIIGNILNSIKGTAAIFGSYAKGGHNKDSDLDIIVIGNAEEKEIKKIGELYNIDINLILNRKISGIIMEEVLKDHIVISGFEDFVKKGIKWTG